MPKVRVTKHTAFEVKEGPVLFSLAARAMPGATLSAQEELAEVADRRGLVIIGVFFPRLVWFCTFGQKDIARA